MRRLLRALTITVITTALAVVAAPSAYADSAACRGAFHSDSRFGPRTLQPRPVGPVGQMLVGYHRFGHLSPRAFLKAYWHNGWLYPPKSGFALDALRQPIEHVQRLEPGSDVDRFGGDGGQFLAPEATSYADRALPPQSLFTFDATYRCNYHDYRVVKAFNAWEGPIAAWFDQPGGGLQIKLDRSLLPGGGYLDVAWLLAHGYLIRLKYVNGVYQPPLSGVGAAGSRRSRTQPIRHFKAVVTVMNARLAVSAR